MGSLRVCEREYGARLQRRDGYTDLEVEDMRPVVGLYPDDLVLVREIQGIT